MKQKGVRYLKSYIKRIFNIMKQDFEYLYKSKVLFALIISIFFVLAVYQYANISTLKNSYKEFNDMVNTYKENNIDIEKKLKEPLKIERKQSSAGLGISTNNPIAYSRQKVLESIYTIGPSYSAQSFLGVWTLLLGPLIFGIFGVYLVMYDYRFRTIKLRAIDNNWFEIIIAKQLLLLILTIIMTILASIIFFLFSLFTYNNIIDGIKGIDLNMLANIKSNSNFFSKLGTSLLLINVFAFFSMFLSIISRMIVLPIIVIFSYLFIIPSLGRYDYKNLVLKMASSTFDRFGSFNYALSGDVNLTLCYLIISLLFLFLFIINIGISKKQSNYV